MISALRRWLIKNAFHEAREDIFERMAEELAKDGAKRTETVAGIFSAWADRSAERKESIAVAYGSIAQKLSEDGASFALAAGQMLPFEERMIIWAGEQNGKLVEALHHAVKVKNALAEMKRATRAAIAQPFFSFVGVLVNSAVLGMMLWPDLMRSIPEPFWPKWALPSIYMDLWLARNWPFLGLVFFVVWAYYYTLPRWTGPVRQFIDRFPPWSAYREENANILLTSLAGFLSNKFTLTRACEEIRDRSSPYLRWHLNRIIPQIESKGEAALEAFNTGIFSQAVLDRLEDAHRTRDIDNTFIHVGDKALFSLVRLVKLRADAINAVASLFVGILFVYSAAVILLATQDATIAYTNHAQHSRPTVTQ